MVARYGMVQYVVCIYCVFLAYQLQCSQTKGSPGGEGCCGKEYEQRGSVLPVLQGQAGQAATPDKEGEGDGVVRMKYGYMANLTNFIVDQLDLTILT